MQTTLEAVEANGLKFHLRPDTSDRVVFEDNVIRQSYQKHGVKVEEGSAWMDIGGYIGTFAANLVRQDAKVIAFEPDPENAELFRQNMLLNDMKVQLIEKAVVRHNNGPMLLYKNTHKGNMAANTLYPHWKREKPSIQVPCLEFQHAFTQAQFALESEYLNVKLDCEGAEIEILEDLPNLPIDQLTLEYHFSVEPDCARWWRIANHLQELGFTVKGSAKVPNEGAWPNFRMQTIQMYCVKSK